MDYYWKGEAMLLGWSETSTRGRTATFLLPEDDDHHPFKDCTIKQGKRAGQRFAVVFVQIGEDERPVPQQRNVSQQAAVLCKDELFWRYADERSFDSIVSEHAARVYLCGLLGIKSRSELDTDRAKAAAFKELQAGFEDYKDSVLNPI
jgi:hypothetical protein